MPTAIPDRDLMTRRLADSNEWVLDRLFHYARERQYVKYSSTLKAAWPLSVTRLSEVLQSAFRDGAELELNPDADYTTDPSSEFGIQEARLHRSRGVNLSMFLGLFKYYRQAFQDLLLATPDLVDPLTASRAVDRVFDRIEIAFCTEWTGTDAESQIRELAESNRWIVTEKNRLLTFFESLESFSFLLDSEGLVREMNLSAAVLLDRPANPGGHYFNPDRRREDLPFLREEVERFLTDQSMGMITELELEISGSPRIFEAQLRRMLDVSGQCEGAALTLVDITRRKENQLRSEEINEKLRQTLAELRSTQRQLVHSEKMAAIGQLAAGVAHEINNPVGFVKSNVCQLAEYTDEIFPLLRSLREATDLIPDPTVRTDLQRRYEECEIDFLDQDTKELIEQTREGLERIVRIVSDLKDFSRQSRGEWESADLNALLESTLTVVHNQLKYKATVIKDYASAASCDCLPGEISQVAMNLILNAAHAIGEQGTITIATGSQAEEVWFSVTDDGSGIPPETLSRIFEPFYTTKPVGEGTGLGLSVSHGIVQKHGGRIEVDSRPGQGTEMLVTLPSRQTVPLSNEADAAFAVR